jgi:ABC-2 type transport system ATP-binding protein
MDRPPALIVENVSFAYGMTMALDGVSFDVAPGTVTVLLGPNGAGKSTLFGLITRLFAIQHGRVAILGLDLGNFGAAALSPLGIVFQQQTLDLDLTARQNLRYFAALRGIESDEADDRIAKELTRLDMAERLEEKVRALNSGHRRRVEIARALLHGPSILLLDEPTVGLDIPTRKALVAHIHQRAREDGVAALWATHLIDEVGVDDPLVVLDKGRVVANGRAADVVAETGAGDLDAAFAHLTNGAA